MSCTIFLQHGMHGIVDDNHIALCRHLGSRRLACPRNQNILDDLLDDLCLEVMLFDNLDQQYCGTLNNSGFPKNANECSPLKITAIGKCGTVENYGPWKIMVSSFIFNANFNNGTPACACDCVNEKCYHQSCN